MLLGDKVQLQLGWEKMVRSQVREERGGEEGPEKEDARTHARVLGGLEKDGAVTRCGRIVRTHRHVRILSLLRS
jgi:hypothetical protein